MNMDWLLILLLVLGGLVLVLADFYVPGFVLATIGAGLLLAALVICYRTTQSWPATAGLLLAESACAGLGLYYTLKQFPNSPLGKRMILGSTQSGVRAQTAASQEWIGREGLAHTLLRPTGVAIIDDQRLDVVAESGIIAAGSRIKVTAVQENRIVVRKI